MNAMAVLSSKSSDAVAVRRGAGLVVLLALCCGSVACASPVFTGDVEADFTGPGVVVIGDPTGIDVGMPGAAPPGAISGNDMKGVRLYYDSAADILYAGLDAYGIAGDVDGDGDAGSTSSWLRGLGGLDKPDFSDTESFALMLDLDEDGAFDVIAGVSARTDIPGYSVSAFTGSPFVPGFAFGAPLAAHTGAVFASPSVTAPDLEFTIVGFSTLPTSGVDTAPSFGVRGYIGSFADGGIGEDHVAGAGTTYIPEPATVLLVGVPAALAALRRRRRHNRK